jgi:hypothetical protein
VSTDGTEVFVTGQSDGSTSASDFATIAYDASTGATIWVARYDGLQRGSSHDGAISIGLSPDGTRLFVTGFSAGYSTLLDVFTIAYDSSTGAALWLKRYNGPGNGNDYAASLGVSPDGDKVFVTGASQKTSDNFKNFDYLTIAYDASTGRGAWVRRYKSPGDGHGQANSLAVSPLGTQVFVTGESKGTSGSFDYATVAYDASTGATRWVNRYNGPGNGNDVARSIDVNPDGAAVFVTGKSPGSSSQDFATIAYKASTGTTRWVARYDGPGMGQDGAASLTVSPLGATVFVTGGSTGSSGSLDYATIAYDVN